MQDSVSDSGDKQIEGDNMDTDNHGGAEEIATEQQICGAAKQHGSRAAEQQRSISAKQQGSRAA